LGISTYVIREEAASGILEAKLLGNYNVVLLLFARLLSGVIVCIVVQLFIIIVSVFLGVMQPSYFLKYCLTLIIYIPSFLGMFGMGLLLGGATLIYKNIGQCIFLIQTALLLVTNVLGMQSQISFFIIPYSIGIDIARRLFLSTSLLSWELFYYFFINIVWFTVGFKIFDILLKKNKQYGYFNSY
jgi:ABC-2 type transport system permease protein